MSNFRHFEIQQVGDISVLALRDPKLFDSLIVSELQDELFAFADDTKPSKVVINFANVSNCSTAVINSLLRLKKKLLPAGGKLRLCGMRETIREAYRMLNLDGTVFDIRAVDDALTNF